MVFPLCSSEASDDRTSDERERMGKQAIFQGRRVACSKFGVTQTQKEDLYVWFWLLIIATVMGV